MLDHIGLTVSDFARARAFFDSALEPLGIAKVMEVPPELAGGENHMGYGSEGKPYFWIGTGGAATGRLHVAFATGERAKVDAFYAAAIAAGGTDNGPPGVRAHYHPNYYGAFVLDPDGHNIEAVCHAPQ
ncbi:VOC family protein [Phenylobacterium sp.]|uniref:VOC family protein n=1 Tax=Phenylobacterium sp. TaxID=1871053 RepID=UPI002732F287|nr:VOC family protein [Phenylobacterium sp.]MDP3854712.1 VOC family protein [Phenylobacterium sp.]